MLNLDARPSGGAAIEALAMQGNPHGIPFPIPLVKRQDCNFSYAGLKTAVSRAVSGAAFGEACDANLQVRWLGLSRFLCIVLMTSWHGRHRTEQGLIFMAWEGWHVSQLACFDPVIPGSWRYHVLYTSKTLSGSLSKDDRDQLRGVWSCGLSCRYDA